MNFLQRFYSNLEKVTATLLGLGISVHLLMLLSLRFGWMNNLFNDSMHRFGPGGDFFSIYAAGLRARHSESIYTVGGHVHEVPYAYAFRYAPIAAYTLGIVLTILPALNAYTFWLVLCEWVMLRNIQISMYIAPDRASAYLAGAIWLLFTPYYLEMYVGQFTFITTSLVFWSFTAWKRGDQIETSAHQVNTKDGRSSERNKIRMRFTSLPFMLAVWLKMMPLLYLPLAIWRKRWYTIVNTITILTITSWLYFQHWPNDWTVFIEVNGTSIPTWHAGNQGFLALLYELACQRNLTFSAAHNTTLVIIGLSLAWFCFLLALASLLSYIDKTTSHGSKADKNQLYQDNTAICLYATCSTAYVLGYKDVWEHHYLILLPPLVLLAMYKAPWWVWMPPFLIAALPSPFVLYDVAALGYNEDPQRYWSRDVSLLHHAIKPMAGIWLLVGLVVYSFQGLPFWRGGAGGGGFRVCRAYRGLPVAVRVALMAALILPPLVLVGRWAARAIAAQHRLTRRLTLPEGVFQLQHSRLTCGPAALASVCRYYGIAATEEELARLAGTDDHGTSMLGLQRAAEARGLWAEGQERTLDELASLPRPCILYFHQGHFAVLTGVAQDRFYVADPSLGQRVWTRAELNYLWRGALLMVGPAR